MLTNQIKTGKKNREKEGMSTNVKQTRMLSKATHGDILSDEKNATGNTLT